MQDIYAVMGWLKFPKPVEKSLEDQIRAILVDFGYSIDPQGYDDGDFKTAVKDLKDLFEEYSK